MDKRDEMIKRIRELRDTNYCRECFYLNGSASGMTDDGVCDSCTRAEDALDEARRLEDELEVMDCYE